MFALILILLLLPIIQAQTSLSFGQTTTGSCPLNAFLSPQFNYTLSMPVEQWPAGSPATQFLVEVQATYDAHNTRTAITIWVSFSSDMSDPWTVLKDGSTSLSSELWIPYNSTMPTVYITVNCLATYSTYSLKPIIPNLMNGTTSIVGFNLISVSAGEPIWWVLSGAYISLGYVWAELCEVPVAAAIFRMRVVNPRAKILNQYPCQLPNTNTYTTSHTFNYWLNGAVTVGMEYVSFGDEVYISICADNLESYFNISYNLYAAFPDDIIDPTNTNYITAAAGLISTAGVVMHSDLVVVGNVYFANYNLDTLKLYYLDSSTTTNLDSMYMQSACYLKEQAQTTLFTGSLTLDNQVSASNKPGVKANNIFHGKTPVDGTLAIMYNDAVVLGTFYIEPSIKLDMVQDNKMLYVVIGLSGFSALVLIALVISCVKLRKHKYQSIQ